MNFSRINCVFLICCNIGLIPEADERTPRTTDSVAQQTGVWLCMYLFGRHGKDDLEDCKMGDVRGPIGQSK